MCKCYEQNSVHQWENRNFKRSTISNQKTHFMLIVLSIDRFEYCLKCSWNDIKSARAESALNWLIYPANANKHHWICDAVTFIENSTGKWEATFVKINCSVSHPKFGTEMPNCLMIALHFHHFSTVSRNMNFALPAHDGWLTHRLTDWQTHRLRCQAALFIVYKTQWHSFSGTVLIRWCKCTLFTGYATCTNHWCIKISPAFRMLATV